jgi:hypothetical protein
MVIGRIVTVGLKSWLIDGLSAHQHHQHVHWPAARQTITRSGVF